MAPIEGAPCLIEKIGAEALASAIQQTTGRPFRSWYVRTQFRPPSVKSEGSETDFLGASRSVLAEVNYEYDGEYPYEMEALIPYVRGKVAPGSAAEIVLSVFGIRELENFDPPFCPFGVKPQTRMSLEGIDQPLVFDHNRYDDHAFKRLGRSLWTIAMLPESVLDEALGYKHFLLASKRSFDEKPIVVSVTRQEERILVEDFFPFVPELEPETPLIVFNY